jgi:2-polyprenyl-6-methoxyphenol hydroxylase-like FAD-dependent oxidoreductase
VHQGPACAHLDRAALHAALWDRVLRHPDVQVTGRRGGPADGPGRVVDATGRRAVTAAEALRPPRTWTAATITVRACADPALHLAAAPDGYAYRLGSARRVTVGWVGPDRPPRDGAALSRRIAAAGCGWLFEDLELPDTGTTVRRPAGLAIATATPGVVAIGDAALTRDALASQGLSLALSDACLAADPAVPTAALAARRADAVRRHMAHLRGTVATCRFAASPAWARYGAWLDRQAGGVGFTSGGSGFDTGLGGAVVTGSGPP